MISPDSRTLIIWPKTISVRSSLDHDLLATSIDSVAAFLDDPNSPVVKPARSSPPKYCCRSPAEHLCRRLARSPGNRSLTGGCHPSSPIWNACIDGHSSPGAESPLHQTLAVSAQTLGALAEGCRQFGLQSCSRGESASLGRKCNPAMPSS